MTSVAKTMHGCLHETEVSGTNPEHISILHDFLSKFYLHEITFVAHLNSVYSIYDTERVERITSQLRLTFDTKHDVNHVRALLDFFSNPTRQPQAWHHINIDQHLLTDVAAHYMNPFTAICPACNQNLNLNDCNRTMVYICHQRGKVLQGIVYSLKCKHKKNNDQSNARPLTIYPNFTEQRDIKRICTKSLNNGSFVYIGGKYAYERALIEQYTADLICNANSWMKTVDSLNRQAFNGEQHQEHIMDRRTLARMMFIYNIVQFDLFIGSPCVDLPRSLDQYDDWVWSFYPRLFASFIYFWSRHKEILGLCTGNKCSEALVVDGHQKCRRRVCKAKEIEIKNDLLEKMIVGCCRTPLRYSKYCELHLHKHPETDNNEQRNSRELVISSHIRSWKTRRSQKEKHFGATGCRTSKARGDSYVRKCARSFGVKAAVTNCCIVTTFGEIFRTETLKEILQLQLLTNSIKVSGVVPKTAVYDDGCHLIEYLHKHIGKDLAEAYAAKALSQIKFSVDRTHSRNHVGSWCRANMNPDKNPLLENINTQAAEQLFSWLKGYALIISSLGWKRASMFLLIIFHHKNLIATNIKSSSVFNIVNQVPHEPTISLMHTADSISLLEASNIFAPSTSSSTNQSNKIVADNLTKCTPEKKEKDNQ
ncbi:unnamed protein product [Rotaria magnacalcarata]|uniref:Uncharacterized protein n=1 Tax=Rotaria magnacalcarata TaxID=392030 RepID=A0A820ADT8_9BILA|nr:unnamed protein product [Rotaria magnacalcarata]